MKIHKFCKKIIALRWALRSLPFSIFFNFWYLPFHQAIKLPILFYKPSFYDLKGTVSFDKSVKIRTGLVQLGLTKCPLYPNTGFVWENHGGNVIFKGRCVIGNSSSISVGEKGLLCIGHRFKATASFRIAAYHSIEFKEKVEFGWDCLVIDSDFHKMTKLDGNYTKGYGSILLKSNIWVGSKSIILKNTAITDYCTVAAGSKVSGKYEEMYSIIGNSSACSVLKKGLWRNIDDDAIIYE